MAPILATATTILAAWLLTYAMHSTVLLGSAWLLTRLRALRTPQMRDLLWKTAILGGLVTTTLHLTLLTGPRLMTIAHSDFALPEVLTEKTLPEEMPAVSATPLYPESSAESFVAPRGNAASAEAADMTAFGQAFGMQFGEAFAAEFGERFGEEFGEDFSAAYDAEHGEEIAEAAPLTPAEEASFWQRGFDRAETAVGSVLAGAKALVTTWHADVPLFASVLLGLWLVGAVGAAVWQLAVHWAFLRTVGRRRRITDPNLIALAHEVGEAAGVRQSLCHKLILTAARGIGSPVALGKNEICLPERALTDLEPDELRGVLAHEWAHLVRRDPLWLRICLLLETVFFFQPLVRIGRQQQMEAAEFLCDAWAVRHTGERHALAQSLVRVAAWLRSEPRRIYGPVMASQGSPLGQRVRTLLGETGEAAREVPAGYRVALAGALVLCVAWLVPGVGIENRNAEAALVQERFLDDDAHRFQMLRDDLARLEASAQDLDGFDDLARLEALDSLRGLAGLVESATGLALRGTAIGLAEARREMEREAARLEAEARTAESEAERIALREAARGLIAGGNALVPPTNQSARVYAVADGDKLEMSWEEGRSSFTVKVCGPVRFAEGGRRIAHMGTGSCVFVHEHQHDARGSHTDSRTLRAEPGPQGLPRYEYEENDRRLTYDAEAAAWLSRTLGELHRRADATMRTNATARGQTSSRSGSGWNRGNATPQATPRSSTWAQRSDTFTREGRLSYSWRDDGEYHSVRFEGTARFDAQTGMPLELHRGSKIVARETRERGPDRRAVVTGREGGAPRFAYEGSADEAWMREMMRGAMRHGFGGHPTPPAAPSAPRVNGTPQVRVTPPMPATPPTRMTWSGPASGTAGLSNTTGGTRIVTANEGGVQRRVVIEGAVTFDAGTGAPKTIAPGGSVVAEEKTGSSTRKVVITPGRGDALDYDFSGHRANLLWLDDFWCHFKEGEGRRGFDQAEAHAQINALLAQGGRGDRTNRVLDAIEDLDGEAVRGNYYRALLGQRLSDAETRRVLRHAEDHLSTDFQIRSVLQYVLQQRPSAAVRADALDIAGDLDSDFEKRQVLLALLGNPLDAQALAQFIAAARDMDSDFEKRQVLTALVQQQPARQFPETLRIRFLGAVEDMDSDFERRQVAQAAARHFDLTDRTVLLAYLAVVDDMDSAFEKRQLLQQLGQMNLGSNEQVAVLEAIEDVDSDFERALLLRSVGRWYERGGARVQRAYRAAAEGLGRSHRQGLPAGSW